jgi:hypothetical protein
VGEPGFQEEEGEAVCPERSRGVEGCEICCAVRIGLELTFRGLKGEELTLSMAQLHTSRSLDCTGQKDQREASGESRGTDIDSSAVNHMIVLASR